MLKMFLTEPLTPQAESRLMERELQMQAPSALKKVVADLIVQ